MTNVKLSELISGLSKVWEEYSNIFSSRQFEAFKVTAEAIENLIYREDKKNDNS